MVQFKRGGNSVFEIIDNCGRSVRLSAVEAEDLLALLYDHKDELHTLTHDVSTTPPRWLTFINVPIDMYE